MAQKAREKGRKKVRQIVVIILKSSVLKTRVNLAQQNKRGG